MNFIAGKVSHSRILWNLAVKLNRFPLPYSRIPINICGNKMYASSLDRFLALCIRKINLMDLFELRFISQLCKPGMNVVDIGANIGLYSILFARQVGKSGHVWCFEPDIKNYYSLKRNMEINSYENVTLECKAVGAFTGNIYLYLSPWHSGDHQIYQSDETREKIITPIVCLDEYFTFDKHIDIMKIDVQGAEGLVLSGMERILTINQHLKIVMEFWPEAIRATQVDPIDLLLKTRKLGFILEELDEKNKRLKRIESDIEFVNSLAGNRSTNIFAYRNNGTY